MDRELFEEYSRARERYWSKLVHLDRYKFMYQVEMCNLKDKVWHNVTPFIESLTINHADDGMSTCDIRLNNRHFELTGRGLITESFGVRIFVGYRDIGLIPQGEFIADMPNPSFDSSFPTISFSCKSLLVESAEVEDIRVYQAGTNTQVMKQIAQSHGWEFEDNNGFYDIEGNYHPDNTDIYYKDKLWEEYANSETQHRPRIKSAITELKFMKRLSVESGNVLYLEPVYNKSENKIVHRLHFHKPKPRKEIYTLWYRCPYNPLLNNILSASINEVTFGKNYAVSTGGINIEDGKIVYQQSKGFRTPLDQEMMYDDYEYSKNSESYRYYGEYERDKYGRYRGGERFTNYESMEKRRAIYEVLTAIERGRFPNKVRRKTRHIPHVLRENTDFEASTIVENIDSATHFLIEMDVNCIYGLPFIFQGMVVRINGLKFYDGLYYVKSVSHTINNNDGLKTTLSLRSNSTEKPKGNNDFRRRNYGDQEEADYDTDDFSEEENDYGSDEGNNRRYPYDYAFNGKDRGYQY